MKNQCLKPLDQRARLGKPHLLCYAFTIVAVCALQFKAGVTLVTCSVHPPTAKTINLITAKLNDLFREFII